MRGREREREREENPCGKKEQSGPSRILMQPPEGGAEAADRSPLEAASPNSPLDCSDSFINNKETARQTD